MKKVVDCKIKYAITDEHITLANADALKDFLLEQDYTREEGGFYRLELDESNTETYWDALNDKCLAYELELEDFEHEPDTNSKTKKSKKPRPADS